MRTRVIGGILVAGLSLALLGGCGGDDDDAGVAPESGSTEPDGTTTVDETTSTTSADLPPEHFLPVPHDESAGTDGDVLLDGRHFGYITTLIAGHNEIVGEFDLVDYYAGAEATAKSIEDGHGEIEGGSEIYLRNVNAELRPITVDPEAVVWDVEYGTMTCCDPVRTDPTRFVATRDSEGDAHTPVNLTIEDGVVVEIQEVYFE